MKMAKRDMHYYNYSGRQWKQKPEVEVEVDHSTTIVCVCA